MSVHSVTLGIAHSILFHFIIIIIFCPVLYSKKKEHSQANKPPEQLQQHVQQLRYYMFVYERNDKRYLVGCAHIFI